MPKRPSNAAPPDREGQSERQFAIRIMFLKATAIPRNSITIRPQWPRPTNQSMATPTAAPPIIPPRVRPEPGCRDGIPRRPLAVRCASAPPRWPSARQAARQAMRSGHRRDGVLIGGVVNHTNLLFASNQRGRAWRGKRSPVKGTGPLGRAAWQVNRGAGRLQTADLRHGRRGRQPWLAPAPPEFARFVLTGSANRAGAERRCASSTSRRGPGTFPLAWSAKSAGSPRSTRIPPPSPSRRRPFRRRPPCA